MIAKLTLLEKAALISGKNVWQTRDVPRVGLRSLSLADGPHGLRKQVGSGDHLGLNASVPATCFPTAATVASSWDTALAEQVGEALGTEAAALDVDVLLGPGLNIKRSPLGGRSFEYFSEDPYLAGKLAAGYVRGIQSRGVAACPKHFAANSQELRRMVNDSVVDERTLRELYLTAFEIVVREAHPRTIMSAYNLVNGVYAHEDPFLLQQVLRTEWGFDGAVVSDWGGSNDVTEAVRRGGTLEMPAPGLDSARQIVAAVQSGELAEADLDARVAELLALVEQSREPGTAPAVDADAHHALARRVAEQSAVLLKNEGGILPLATGTRVALIGDFAQTPRYQGAGSSVVNPTRLDTTLDRIGASGLTMTTFAQGFRRDGVADEALLREAVAAAGDADVALVYLGLDELSESEGLDRSHLALAANQVALLDALAEVTQDVVVVLSAGAVVELPWIDRCRALVHGYLSGQAGADALLHVLTGVVNPSGRLAESYPVRGEDVPAYPYFPGRERTSEYREGLFVGYRYYSTAGVPVAFPFGFGLSYTTFAYADLVATPEQVTVTVTNTGDRAGAEVVQVYVGRVAGGVHGPARELKGFAKVHLEAGERRTVTIALDDKAFRHFDVATGTWQVETGSRTIHVGASVEDIRLTAEVAVAGTVEPAPQSGLDHYRAADVHHVPDEEFARLLGRPIPAGTWSGPLGLNDALGRMGTARSPLARLIHRFMAWQLTQAEKKGKPDLDALFRYNMPFRAVSKMSNGMASQQMAEDIVTLANGRTLVGLGRLVRDFFRNRRANSRTLKDLASGSTPPQR
jgi:beta-glucosidase